MAEITIFQDGIIQDGIAQLIVILATVLMFRALYTTIKLAAPFITTIKTEFFVDHTVGDANAIYEEGSTILYFEDGSIVYETA